MRAIRHLFSWNRNLIWTIGLLILLIIASFYGLYTNKFYIFKLDNYIFPFLAIVHFTYLYALWFKIREKEIADVQMRNLEFALYLIFFVYLFKVFDILSILMTYEEFQNHALPKTFMPIGILILVFHVLLLGMTLLNFKYRMELVGNYKFDELDGGVDSWE